MQKKFEQSDVEDYILYQINGLQEILTQFDYPHFANSLNKMKELFIRQSETLSGTSNE